MFGIATYFSHFAICPNSFFKLRLLALSLFVSWGSVALKAQSLQDQIQFMGEYYWQSPIYNPCFAGSRALPSFALSGAWGSEYTRNPYTVQAFWHTYIDTIKSGIGLSARYHKFDDTYYYGSSSYPTNKVYADASLLYNYVIVLSEKSIIQVGAQIGAVHYKANDPIYYNPYNPQPALLLNERKVKFDLGFGTLFTIQNFYMGLHIAHSNEPTFQFTSPGTIYRMYRTLFLQSGYSFNIHDKLYIQPSFMMQAPLFRYWGNSSVAFRPLIDINVQVDYKNKIFAAMAYRINGAPFFMSFKAGGRLKNVQLSLAYHLGKNNYSSQPQRLEACLGFFIGQNNNDNE